MDIDDFENAKGVNTDFHLALAYGTELAQERAREDMDRSLEQLAQALYENNVFTRAWANWIGGGLFDLFDFIFLFGNEYTAEDLRKNVFSERFLQFLKEVGDAPIDISPLGEANVSILEDVEKKSVEIGEKMHTAHYALFNVWMRAITKFWRMFHLEHPASKESHYAQTIVEAMATNAFLSITFSEGMAAFIRFGVVDLEM